MIFRGLKMLSAAEGGWLTQTHSSLSMPSKFIMVNIFQLDAMAPCVTMVTPDTTTRATFYRYPSSENHPSLYQQETDPSIERNSGGATSDSKSDYLGLGK